MRDVPKPVNSNNREYQVYALIDPRDKVERYVGVTKKNIYLRLGQHIDEASSRKDAKGQWLVELRNLGMYPEVKILETIQASENSDYIAKELETKWIYNLLRSGRPLLNVSGVASYKREASKNSRYRENFSTEFERLRNEARLTIGQLAAEAHIARATVQRMQNGLPVLAPLASRACNVLSRYLGYEVDYEAIGVKTT